MSNQVKPEFPQYSEDIAAQFMRPSKGAGGLHEYLGLRIVEAGPGTMHGQLDVREELLTMIGNMHGGVLSAFCDHMLGCVCYPIMQPGSWAATTEFKINLTAPVSKGVVDAYAEIVNLSRTLAIVRIELVNEGRIAALAQGTVTIRAPKQ